MVGTSFTRISFYVTNIRFIGMLIWIHLRNSDILPVDNCMLAIQQFSARATTEIAKQSSRLSTNNRLTVTSFHLYVQVCTAAKNLCTFHFSIFTMNQFIRCPISSAAFQRWSIAKKKKKYTLRPPIGLYAAFPSPETFFFMASSVLLCISENHLDFMANKAFNSHLQSRAAQKRFEAYFQ